jgi:hypothetical protein
LPHRFDEALFRFRRLLEIAARVLDDRQHRLDLGLQLGIILQPVFESSILSRKTLQLRKAFCPGPPLKPDLPMFIYTNLTVNRPIRSDSGRPME